MSEWLLWMDKYAKDIVKIDRVKGRDDQPQQRRYEVLVNSKWKKVRTLSECVSHVMEQSGRDFWEDMLNGCIIDLAGSSGNEFLHFSITTFSFIKQ